MMPHTGYSHIRYFFVPESLVSFFLRKSDNWQHSWQVVCVVQTPQHFLTKKKTSMTENNLSGKIALVTGASRGIGRAISLELARRGAHVIALARTQGALEELDEEINALGGQATLITCDLKNHESVDAIGPAIYQRWKKLDIFIGNAAILKALSPAGHVTEAHWNETIEVNLSANWRLLRTVDPLLKLSGEARAVFITDRPESSAYWGAYTVSKAGLEQVAQNYAAENATTNIRVSVVDPGIVATRLRSQAFPGEQSDSLKTPGQLASDFIKILEAEQQNPYQFYSFRA